MVNRASQFFLPIKIFSMVVLVLMVLAVAYAVTMALRYWSGIGV